MNKTHYTPKAIFRLYPILFAVATVWLASETWQRRSIVWGVMLVGVGFITLRLILGAFAWAEFDGETLVYHTPLRPEHRLTTQQLALVEMGGRKNEALIIGYHPKTENGLIDASQRRFINFIPLEGQGELFEKLQEAMA